MKYIKELIINKNDFEKKFKILIKESDIQIKFLKVLGINDKFYFEHKDFIIEQKIINWCLILVEKFKNSLSDKEIEKITRIIIDSDDQIIINNYAIDILKEEIPEAEKYILRNNNSVFNYASKILKRRWKEGEDKLIKTRDLHYVFQYYIKNVFKKNSNDPKHRWKEGEDLIAINPAYAVSFARYYHEGRWEKGEKAILTSPKATLEYIMEIFKGRAPQEFEQIILKDPKICYEYYIFLKNKLKINWDEGLKVILNDPQTAYDYSVNFLKKRIPEAEMVIARDPKLFVNYCKLFFEQDESGVRKRLIERSDIDPKVAKEGEKNIFKDPQSAVTYIYLFIKRRIKEIEKDIAEDPKAAYEYAKLILKKEVGHFKSPRWINIPDIDQKIAIKAERNILNNPEIGIQYAKDVIRGRWKELEDEIINYEDLPLEYAREVIDGPWPEAGITEEDVWPEPEEFIPDDEW